ncbi:hypothetical protein H671_2g8140 [Cricetulus griseus]|nr:hypothetical protein H671_2g8140 [Cricetulus griseus]
MFGVLLASCTFIGITFYRTSRTIFKRYGESGQPCLIPDFRGITLSFSPFSLMLAVGLVYIAFIMFSLMLAIGLVYITFIMFRFVSVIPVLSKIFIMKG